MAQGGHSISVCPVTHLVLKKVGSANATRADLLNMTFLIPLAVKLRVNCPSMTQLHSRFRRQCPALPPSLIHSRENN